MRPMKWIVIKILSSVLSYLQSYAFIGLDLKAHCWPGWRCIKSFLRVIVMMVIMGCNYLDFIPTESATKIHESNSVLLKGFIVYLNPEASLPKPNTCQLGSQSYMGIEMGAIIAVYYGEMRCEWYWECRFNYMSLLFLESTLWIWCVLMRGQKGKSKTRESSVLMTAKMD